MLIRKRCKEAETKLGQIVDFVMAALAEDEGSDLSSISSTGPPSIIITPEPDMGDFGPASVSMQQPRVVSGTAAKRLSRAAFTHMDLAGLSERFGSLGGRGKGQMIREESGWALDQEDVY